MRSIVWVGPLHVLTGYEPLWRAVCDYQTEKMSRREATRIAVPADHVCVSKSGGVYEFRGWRNIHVIRGHVIATADQLGGDEWMEWLRNAGLL